MNSCLLEMFLVSSIGQGWSCRLEVGFDSGSKDFDLIVLWLRLHLDVLLLAFFFLKSCQRKVNNKGHI